MMAAAGAGGAADPLYVEDLFNTNLYKGTGDTSFNIENGIALGDTNAGACVEFDGTNDWLTRTGDFSGNADGNSFTFSCWCFKAVDGESLRVFTDGESSGTDSGLLVYAGNNDFAFYARDDADTTILGAHAYSNLLKAEVWTHVLISIDLSSASNRYVYFNDVNVTSSFTFGTYTDDDINFTTTTQSIGKAGGISTQLWQGRLSSLFLDYTYRDLSVTSNRRLFITADGQPAANQASLSPIMFMPLDDTNAIGKNLGTGGDFTVNGSPTALSQGGPYIDSGYGEGGMVWLKFRYNALGSADNAIYDTVRGVNNVVYPNTNGAEASLDEGVEAFNTSGFDIGAYNNENGSSNYATANYVGWTFRKAPGFFDIIEYTGNSAGTGSQDIAHSLDSQIGLVIIKRTDAAGDWYCQWHQSNDHYYTLNSDLARTTDGAFWGATSFTPTQFQVGGTASTTNIDGATYIAYVWGQGGAAVGYGEGGGKVFGEDKDEDIIKCGTYTGNGSTDGPEITLDWEPQFVMLKSTTNDGKWMMADNMRGMCVDDEDPYLAAEVSNAEYTSYNWIHSTATGFKLTNTGVSLNTSGDSYKYMAIRRPMKTPTAGTEVFSTEFKAPGSGEQYIDTGHLVDTVWYGKAAGAGMVIGDRLRGVKGAGDLFSSSTAAVGTNTGPFHFDHNIGGTWSTSGGWGVSPVANDENYWRLYFKRAAGFYDTVFYDGDSASSGTGNTQDVSHNLGVVPEFMLIKRYSSSADWVGYHKAFDEGNYIYLDGSSELSANPGYNIPSRPTASVFTVGDAYRTNSTGSTYICYMWATLEGVSKVGSYTSSGTVGEVIDCGFSATARFILIKRIDGGSEDWYMWTSTRGIVSGDDPYRLLNNQNAEVTNSDYVDPNTSGFQLPGGGEINASGETYIFLAIA